MGLRQSFRSLRDSMHTAQVVFDTMHHHSVRRLVEHGINVKVPELSPSDKHATIRQVVSTVDTQYDQKIRRGTEGYTIALRELASIVGNDYIISSFDGLTYAEKTAASLERTLRTALTDDSWFSPGKFETKQQFERMIVAIYDLTSKPTYHTRNSVRTLPELCIQYSSTVFALWLYHHNQLFPVMQHVIREWEQDDWLTFHGEDAQADTIRMVLLMLCHTLLQDTSDQDVPWAWREHVLVSQITDPERIQNAWKNARSIVLHTAPIRATLGRLSLTPWWLKW